jgi:hypothetical protein
MLACGFESHGFRIIQKCSWSKKNMTVSGSTRNIFQINTSSRSSPECSPPCQGGDQGFKSPRGRFSQDQRNSFALAEHWRAQVAVTHPPSGFGGSTPSRRIHKQYRPFVQRLRMLTPQAGEAGSTPIRSTDTEGSRIRFAGPHC